MDDNEDEPVDVRNATPVEDEITRGAIDEHSDRPIVPIETTRKRHHCDKDAPKKPKKFLKKEGDCCRAKLAKSAKVPKTATVKIYEKECVLPKTKPIPRHCLTKEEWLDILATPSRKCPPSCLQREVTRKIRPVSTRMAELALPPRNRLLNTLRDRGATLPTELVDNLIQTLEGEACLTPEQAELMFRDKDDRARKKCRKKTKKRCCKESKLNERVKSEILSNSKILDKEAVNCQYTMAENFVKSILEWKCPIPRDEFKDIAEVILKRLGYVLEYEPVEGEDRKSQQMRFLADIVASWIAGVLFDVAEARRTELEEECEKRRVEEAEESEEDDSDDESEVEVPDEDEDDDDDGGKGGGKKDEEGGGKGGRGGGPPKKGKDDKGKKPGGDDEDHDDDDKTHGESGMTKETEEQGKEDRNDGKTDGDGAEEESKEDGKQQPAGEGVVDAELKAGLEDLTPDNVAQAELAQKEVVEEEKEKRSEEELYHDARGESIFISSPKETSQKKPEDLEAVIENKSEEEEPQDESTEASKKGIMSEVSEMEKSGDEAKVGETTKDQIQGLDDVRGKEPERATIPETISENDTKNVEAEVVDTSKSLEATKTTEATPLAMDEKLVAKESTIDHKADEGTMEKSKIDERAAGDKKDDGKALDEPTWTPEVSPIPEIKEKEPVEIPPLVVGDFDRKNEKKDTTTLEKTGSSVVLPEIKIKDKPESKKIVTTLPGAEDEIAAIKKKPSRIPSSIALVKTRKKLFQTDTPFLTFDKIFHTIYNAIEGSRENPGMDAITNRIHRAVYEKCSNVVREEKSEPLAELTKDLLDVMSGKIALWLRDILTESQLSFMNKYPATVESVDVREWTKWIGYVSDTADNWSMWIKKTIKQVEDMRSGKITRGDWADWTKTVDEDALLWRRFYVESLHQAHQNLTMIRDRRVVKTGGRDIVDGDYEKEMEITDLDIR